MRAEHSNSEKFQAAPEVVATPQSDVVTVNGANGPGVYTGDPDGASANGGSGKGNAFAVGRPCAGCVGKADDKNPPGQLKETHLPGSSEGASSEDASYRHARHKPDGGYKGDAGYECDTNRGIARGNPAHSPCIQAASPPVVPEIPTAPEIVVVAVQEQALARTGLDTPELAIIGSSLVLGGALMLGLSRRLRASGRTRDTNRCARRGRVARGASTWMPHAQPTSPVVGCDRRAGARRDRHMHAPVAPQSWRAGSAAHHRRAIGAHC